MSLSVSPSLSLSLTLCLCLCVSFSYSPCWAGAVAVHCKAGLGRTGTCIGCYMMKHFRMTGSCDSLTHSLTLSVTPCLIWETDRGTEAETETPQLLLVWLWDIDDALFRLHRYLHSFSWVVMWSDLMWCDVMFLPPTANLSGTTIAEETIGWLRHVRPGSVIGPQQQYMKDMQVGVATAVLWCVTAVA